MVNMKEKLLQNEGNNLPSVAGELSISTDEKPPNKSFPWLLSLIFIIGVTGPGSLQSGLLVTMQNIYIEKYGLLPSTNAITASLGTGLALFIAPVFGNIKNSLSDTRKSCYGFPTQVLNINKYLFLFGLLNMVLTTLFWLPQLGSYSENFYNGLLQTLNSPVGTITTNLLMAWVYSFLTDANQLAILFALFHICPVLLQIVGTILGPTLSASMSYGAYLGVNIFISLILIGIFIVAFIVVNARQVQSMSKVQDAIDKSTKHIEDMSHDSSIQIRNTAEEPQENLTCTLRRIFSSPLFALLIPISCLAGYFSGTGPGSTLYKYLYLSIFSDLTFEEINQYIVSNTVALGVGILVGAMICPFLGQWLGYRKLGAFAIFCAAILAFIQSLFLSTQSPGVTQAKFMVISILLQGFCLSNTTIAVGAMQGIAIDYEFLYSGVRKEVMFSTAFNLIQTLVATVTQTLLLSILTVLGFQNNTQTGTDDDYLSTHYPIAQNSSVKTFLIIVTNWGITALYLFGAIMVYRFPVDKKEHDLILAEIEIREESPLTYNFHDPIYPQNSESNQRRVTFFAQGQRISVATQKEMESFFFYFSRTEIQLLQEPRGGKHIVRTRFKLDLVMLICYTLIFLTCFIISLVKGELQLSSLNLIFLLISGFFTSYQVMRFSAMKKLKEMQIKEVVEHATYCGKRRFIQHINDVKRWKLVVLRFVPHVIALFFAVVVIIIESSKSNKFTSLLGISDD